jgi:hypothetical protein
MNSIRQKINKNPTNNNLTASRNSSKNDLLTKPAITRKPALSPSNSKMTSQKLEPSPLSKERSNSIKSKSSFKLYIGNKKQDVSKSRNK